MSADPGLGALRSEHWPALTYPVLFSLIGLCLAVGGVFVGLNGDTQGFGVAAAATIFTDAYLYVSSRRRLYLYENGLLLGAGGRERFMMWRDVTAVTPTYSYNPHPDTIIEVTFRSGAEPRLVLRMTWTSHRALRRAVWALISPSPLAPSPALGRTPTLTVEP